VYAHVVFLKVDIQFKDSSHQIPNWPFQSLESLLILDQPVSSRTMDYFMNLTAKQYLCFIHTAKNFEASSLAIKQDCLDSFSFLLYFVSSSIFVGTISIM
jgi:hypothetical protein